MRGITDKEGGVKLAFQDKPAYSTARENEAAVSRDIGGRMRGIARNFDDEDGIAWQNEMQLGYPLL